MDLQLLYLCFAFAGFAKASDWNYGEKSNWHIDHPDCGGKYQSPINIQTWRTTSDNSMGYFDHSIFDMVPHEMHWENNGHTLVLRLGDDDMIINDKALLPEPYRLAQCHFHWGANASSLGSEHTLNGRRYFGEMHLVYYNTKYANLEKAFEDRIGIAVLAFFLEVSDQRNPEFGRLLQVLGGEVVPEGWEKVIKYPDTFSIGSIFPDDITMYYRYFGSLTTPPCHESVLWTVFRQPIRISASQANTLSHSLLEGASGKLIQSNYRELQPLNGRYVTHPKALHCDLEF